MKKNDIKWEKLKKCYLCSSSNISIFLKNVRYWENDINFNFSKCKKCDFVFLNPRPQQKYISKFYKSESYWGADLGKDEILTQNREKSFGPIYSLIDQTKKGKIFDIGAGTGLFLTFFKELDWSVNGIEYSPDAVRFAKKKYKINLKKGDLMNMKIKKNEKYDYIIMNNVLEHLYKPLPTLKLVNKMLEVNGKLIIAVPNIDSLGFRIFNNNWYPLQPPIHLSQFSPKTLELILKKSDFKVIKISHEYPVHSEFSLFESYRSLLTGRNNKLIKSKGGVSTGVVESRNIKDYIKQIGVLIGHISSFIIAEFGYFLNKGENIIIYAEKK